MRRERKFHHAWGHHVPHLASHVGAKRWSDIRTFLHSSECSNESVKLREIIIVGDLIITPLEWCVVLKKDVKIITGVFVCTC